jgi:hypothetical protein
MIQNPSFISDVTLTRHNMLLAVCVYSMNVGSDVVIGEVLFQLCVLVTAFSMWHFSVSSLLIFSHLILQLNRFVYE